MGGGWVARVSLAGLVRQRKGVRNGGDAKRLLEGAQLQCLQFDCQGGVQFISVLFTTLVLCLVDLLDRWFRITFQVSQSWET